jgi:hypothetical protein
MSKNSVVTFKIADKNTTFYTHLSSKIKLLLGRSSTDFRISNKLDIKLNKTLIKKISLKIIKNKSLFISTGTGFFHINEGKLYKVFEKDYTFFGIASYQDRYFVACAGNRDQGGIFSFDYKLGEIQNLKEEYKINNQSLHSITINKGFLYVVNSTWRYNLDEVIKFKIVNKSLQFIEKIKPKTEYPFYHCNKIYFKDKFIYVTYHNWTEKTKMPSQICRFDSKWNFLDIVDTKNTLADAHNFSIIDNKIFLANSGNSEFLLGNKKITFKGKFIRGFDHDNENYYIGVGNKTSRKERKNSYPRICVINKKNLKKKFLNLPKIGEITEIKIIK